MKTAISILLILVLSQCVHAGLWETGFRLDGPIGESPTPAPAAADSSVGTSDYKVAGWALILGGGLIMALALNRTEYVCEDKGDYIECGEEYRPNWTLSLAGVALCVAGDTLRHHKGK